MSYFQLNWSTGRVVPLRKCIEKYRNSEETHEIRSFLKITPDQFGSIPRLKKQHFNAKNNIVEIKIQYGAKHSPLPLPLDRPLADFWGPRAGAWFWHFDPILPIDKLNESRNSSKVFYNYIRSLRCLIMSSIGPQEGLGRLGLGLKNVKVQKFEFFWISF